MLCGKVKVKVKPNIYKKRGKEFLQSSLKNKFLGLLKGQGKLENNF